MLWNKTYKSAVAHNGTYALLQNDNLFVSYISFSMTLTISAVS